MVWGAPSQLFAQNATAWTGGSEEVLIPQHILGRKIREGLSHGDTAPTESFFLLSFSHWTEANGYRTAPSTLNI